MQKTTTGDRLSLTVTAAVRATVVLIGAYTVLQALTDSSHFGWCLAIGLFCSPVLVGAMLVF
jgi:hypothetical protein